MKVVIPGGTGQVGNVLARHFLAAGHEVVVLSRKPATAPWRMVAWDAQQLGDWAAELEGAEAVINLAGRSVNCRYNAANRREIHALPDVVNKMIERLLLNSNSFVRPVLASQPMKETETERSGS